jgi:hypothetical protein
MVLFAKHIVFSLLACFLMSVPRAAAGPLPTLTNITVSNTHDDLLLHLQLEGSLSEKIKRQILDGTPASFAFIIRLEQVRDLWVDQKIADLRVVHTIRYDNLKKEFTVRRSWKGNEAETTTSFEEAQHWMNQIDSLAIVALSRMQKGSQYELLTKAELSKRSLPLGLHHVLFFISFWDEETDWYIINFTY